jgi:type IV pilus assembly protein PilQ
MLSTSLVIGQWKLPGRKSDGAVKIKKKETKLLPELLDIYTTEEDSSFMLVMEFSNANIEYMTSETFAPPSVTLSISRVKWERGNFTKKSSHSPLFHYTVNVPRNSNQQEIKNTLQVRMGFTRVPDYKLKLEPANPKSPKHKLKVIWQKGKTDKPVAKYVFPSRRLPESKVTMNFRGAQLVNVVRLLASQDNLNLILSGDIKGELTLTLEDVSLETALDAILHVNKYEWFLQDNIIIVQPMTSQRVMSGELTTRIYRLSYIKGTTATAAVQEALTGRGKIKALSSTQSTEDSGGEQDILMITDIPSNFDLIDSIVKSLDVEGDQINIAVKFIETTLKHDETIGINWNLRETMYIPGGGEADTTSTIKVGHLKIPGETMSFATLTAPVVSAMLDLLANDGDTKLLQEPQVTTMSNSAANIVVGTTVPVLVPQGEGSVFGSNPYTYEDQSINVSLSVLPRVNSQDVISMKIDAVVQAVVGYVGAEQRPMVSTRSTNTNVRVANGETLLIGGLIFDNDLESMSKMPLLGDLPFINKIFRYRNTEREQRELLIFITPTVISASI